MSDQQPFDQTKQSKGGVARAEKLSPERRREIGAAGAQARWLQPVPPDMPNALVQGELPIGDFVLRCFVLDDSQHRRVISGRTMTNAIGMRGRGQGMARIAGHRTISDFFSNDLRVAIETPILFNGSTSRKANPTHGYEGTILQEICDAILKARLDGRLKTEQEKRYGTAAETLIRAFAREGINSLIDKATGYREENAKGELHAILAAYISPTLLPWTETFPYEFFEEMFRVYGWKWPPSGEGYRGPLGPRYAGKLIKQVIYGNLPPGVLNELEQQNPADARWQRKSRMSRLLTDNIGHPHVEKLVAVATALFRVSGDRYDFKRNYEKAFPKKGQQIALILDETQDELPLIEHNA